MFEASHRLLAGLVSRRDLQAMQKKVLASPDAYPWQEVVDGLVAEPVAESELIQRGLKAQRDWILRGGREMPGPRVKTRAKAFLARLLAQGLFLGLWTGSVLVLLVLLKARFPECDIYIVSNWLKDLMPGIFGAK